MNTFCHKCGKRLETGDKFCQYCGAKVSTDVQNTTNKLGRPELEKKAWYRALKVFYILVASVCVLAIVLIAWGLMPHRELDDMQSRINCYEGSSYAPGNNNIYTYGDNLDSFQDEDARILCKYDTISYYSHEYETIPKNYTFAPVYVEPDYSSWFGYTVLALVIALGVFAGIRTAFFYIATGEKPHVKQ